MIAAVAWWLIPFLPVPFIEAFFLETFGTTPGKKLFNIQLIPANEGKIKYSQAFKRSFSVLIHGCGLGLPIIGLFCSVSAYSDLKKTGKTYWDSKYDFIVTHKKFGFFRYVLAVFILMIVIVVLQILLPS